VIARKLAVLFGFNRSVQPFYAACRFDELSRGSVSCHLNTSFEKHFHSATTRIFTQKSMQKSMTMAILAQWRHPEASRLALDLPYWAMRSAPYLLIRMAIEMASESAAFFSVLDYLSCITVAK
jgi:hypothetical protein